MVDRYGHCEYPGGDGWAVYNAHETSRTGRLKVVESGLSREGAKQMAAWLNDLNRDVPSEPPEG